MSAEVDAAKRNSNDIHEQDDTVSSEEKMGPAILAEPKQKPNRSETSAKKRRATIYTPAFRAEILEFVKDWYE